MGTRFEAADRVVLMFSVLLICGLISACVSTTPQASIPPESYKGPIAERPVFQQGDYWVYQRGNSTRVKSTVLAGNIGFPLWIGKTWSYDVEMIRAGQSPTSNTPRMSAISNCYVVAFKQVAVAAGTFEAFECECQCTHQSAHYEPGCGEWTIWYAPVVKNIIRTRTGGTETSMELIEYRTSRPAPGSKVPPAKASGKGGQRFGQSPIGGEASAAA